MSEILFDRVTVIGFGLIGSSFARAARKHGLVRTIVCADMSRDVCDRADELGLCDEAYTDMARAVTDADLVVLAVPVGVTGEVARLIAPALKPGAIVTDVGSVKAIVVREVKKHLPPHARFIGGHPIAGTEHSGPDAGFAELFVNRWCILTPEADADRQSVDRLTALWRAFGSKIEEMEPAHHDLVLAITSHLPHLIAYTIVGTATHLEEDKQSEVIKFSASGFRDFTRIAASDPVMWRDIFLNNKEAVLEILQRFTEDLTALQRAIRYGDGEQLFDVFTRTRNIRRRIIDAGQADYPKQAQVQPSAEVPPAQATQSPEPGPAPEARQTAASA